MKKTGLLLFFLLFSLTLLAQGPGKDSFQTSLHKVALFEGRSPYIAFGIGSSTPPHPSYDIGGELGLWGTKKPTTLGLTFDAVRSEEANFFNHWIGIKPYLTIFGTDKASFMVYIAPKVETEDLKKILLEIGINPVFNINKHFLFSFSVCDQVWSHSEWNFGGCIGIVYIK